MKIKQVCTVQLSDEAKKDISLIPKEYLTDLKIQLKKLSDDILLGKKLYNLHNKDLSNCRKIYFADAKYRIVYRVIDDVCEVLEIDKSSLPIADVVAIGKRENQEVYKLAFERITDDAAIDEE
ncbi:MAG: hypothetical protein E6902_14595 [Paeniclostridium sordellii]|nr:hypothetical protein [Paeniclostridium sordellii]